jgi:hypothetical protein
MVLRRFSVLQRVVALVPLLLLAIYLPGQMMLRCRIDGLLREACCCPPDGEPPSSMPVLKAQDCCDREAANSARPPGEATPTTEGGLIWTPTLVVARAPVALLDPPPAIAGRQGYGQGPAREGPAIVLLKHAFLI